MAVFGAAIQGGVNAFISDYNNEAAAERERRARYENYLYNEMGAERADARTRSLYNDLYSPAAQMEQIRAAGLSPSVFYGDMNGIAGNTGAQGAGAAGISPSTFGMSPIDLSNLALNDAQTNKLLAEASNIRSQTKHTDLENEVKDLENSVYKQQWSLINAHVVSDNNEMSSIYELANESGSYEAFVKDLRTIGDNSDPELKYATTNEVGQQMLRQIYENARAFDRNISVLSREAVDAGFYESITKSLQENDYAKLNAQEAIQTLRESIESNKLDERQQKAWNNLIKKLDQKNSTGADIAIALLLMLNNVMSNWKMPSKKGSIIGNNIRVNDK